MVMVSDNIAEHKEAYMHQVRELINYAVNTVGISTRQLAKEIGILRVNIYSVKKGRYTLTGFQLSLLFNSLKNRGVDPNECLEKVLGGCEELSSHQLSSRSQLSSLLQRRRRMQTL